MTNKKSILIVDDSPSEIRIIMEVLKSDYAVVATTNGEEALTKIEENKPDLVLLDVNMEPMDGYEVCEKIRETDEELPVIFISSNNSTEEILKGFQVGGFDYLVKPIDPVILPKKIITLLEQRDKHESVVEEKQLTSQMAMDALRNAGELGTIIDFMKKAVTINTSNELANLLLEATDSMQLNCTILIENSLSSVSVSKAQSVNPLETELMQRARNANDRLLDCGRRVFAHFESVVILVKNMPDDASLRGRLLDHILIMAECAHGLNMKCEQEAIAVDQRTTRIRESLREALGTIKEIQDFQTTHKESSQSIMDKLLIDVEEQFFTMGLTEEQENMLMDLLTARSKESLEHFEKGLEVDEQMRNIAKNLSQIAKL
ncbi:response regulator [Aliikangiella marina]|uniref:Response regulator n=1 Tax=Aliikangiella marina TaxID=1712262 RepID=A0A545T9V7_9GAMM|nr:response regulator [Aliikangiella marina]TQV73995.1 response regulator [Aliikangiella marina]